MFLSGPTVDGCEMMGMELIGRITSDECVDLVQDSCFLQTTLIDPKVDMRIHQISHSLRDRPFMSWDLNIYIPCIGRSSLK